MILRGRPDFQATETLPDGPVWAGYQTQSWLAPPTIIDVAIVEGAPALHLSITRPPAPFLPPPPYAVLDATFAARRDSDAALEALRHTWPRATLGQPEPAAGSMLLAPLADASALPPGLAGPFEARWSGLGGARVTQRLDIDAATRLAAMIEDGTLPFAARMALAFDGVSPRLPLSVAFDPAALLAALAEMTPPEGLTLTELTSRIAATGSTLPVEPSDHVPLDAHTDCAATMADRIAARFGTTDPPTGAEPRVHLATPDQVRTGRFTWDLAVPVPARRWLTLAFDPFVAIRDFVVTHGASGLVTRSVAPTIPAGRHRITALANLPPHRTGIEALGLTLRAEPAPPWRPHAAVASAMIEPPIDEVDIDLDLARGEPLIYSARAFAVIADASGVLRLDGPARTTSDPILHLSPDDFALRMAALEASPDLLTIARLDGVLRYRHDDLIHETAFRLDADAPGRALGLPAAAEDATIQLSVHPLDGGDALHLGPLPALSTRFALTSFPSFGPQTATIRCAPLPPHAVVAIEIAAEDHTDTDVETLAFTPDIPERTWRYFARSPFRGNFRWRPRPAPGIPPDPWRLASPEIPLDVRPETVSAP